MYIIYIHKLYSKSSKKSKKTGLFLIIMKKQLRIDKTIKKIYQKIKKSFTNSKKHI